MRALPCLAAALGALGLAGPLPPAAADEPDNAPAATAPTSPALSTTTLASWCAPELEALPSDICASVPPKEAQGPRTLIIFLHGVIQPDTTWQWAQQRAASRAATRHGFTVIAPRGRRGIGPKGMADWWTWPTAAAAQKTHEDALITEWNAARAELEKRAGKPFDRVFLFGFSNGAYYAASLAVRDRIKVDGYAVFAGGSGAKHLKQAGARTTRRAPFTSGGVTATAIGATRRSSAKCSASSAGPPRPAAERAWGTQ